MVIRRTSVIILLLIIAAGLTLSFHSFLSTQAASGILYVAPGGNCGSAVPCYATLQAAVDAAEEGDELRIAAGVYPLAAGDEQIVRLDKDLTLRGGYTIDNWNSSDPQAHLTILDAQSQGRVVLISGTAAVNLFGLQMINGSAAGLGGANLDADAGGALYSNGADVAITASAILTSTAEGGWGGGIYVTNSPHGLHIQDTLVRGNRADHGGGISIIYASFWLNHSTVQDNFGEQGGGVYIDQATAVVDENLLQRNSSADGGGIYARWSGLTFTENALLANEALQGGMYGGGLWVDTAHSGPILIEDNLIQGNRACDGAGINLFGPNPAVIAGNIIVENVASDEFYNGHGGGLYIDAPGVRLERNIIQRNQVIQGSFPFSIAYGGGVVVAKDITLTNNLITDNQVLGDKALAPGVYVHGASPTFIHNTLANNTGGDGSAVYAAQEDIDHTPARPVLFNSLIAQQAIGVYVSDALAENAATLTGVLWWENKVNAVGLVTASDELTGDPVFVNTAGFDYHLNSGSAAIDASPAVLVAVDIDNQPRLGTPDLGCDEYWGPGTLTYLYLPVAVKG